MLGGCFLKIILFVAVLFQSLEFTDARFKMKLNPDDEEPMPPVENLEEMRAILASISNGKDLTRMKRSEPPNERTRRSLSETLKFERYYTYDEIVDFLKEFTRQCKFCQMEKIGRSIRNNSIYVLKVLSQETTDSIYITGGAHAREWISPATTLSLAHQFALNPDNNADIADLTKKYNWYFVITYNPDGYIYSMLNSTNRRWRKNLRETTIDGKTCLGVDLNRNFDFYHNETVRNPCANTYGGTAPFSEPETQAMSNFALRIKSTMKAHISMHSYGKLFTYPPFFVKYNDSECARFRNGSCDLKADELCDQVKLSIATRDAMDPLSNETYLIGPGYCVIRYVTRGNAHDWMQSKVGIRYSVLFELPPKWYQKFNFNLPASRIKETIVETLAGVIAFMKELQIVSK